MTTPEAVDTDAEVQDAFDVFDTSWPSSKALGRPKNRSSDETRRRLTHVAREHFAQRGYASASITAVAADAGVAPSAVYHYYASKAELYEAVYFATAPAVWDDMAVTIGEADSLLDAVDALLLRGEPRDRAYTAFLAGMPTVAALHPELRHLLAERLAIQDRVLRVLAERAHDANELGAFTVDETVELLRVCIAGCLFERFYTRAESLAGARAVVKALAVLVETRRNSPADDRAGIGPNARKRR